MSKERNFWTYPQLTKEQPQSSKQELIFGPRFHYQHRQWAIEKESEKDLKKVINSNTINSNAIKMTNHWNNTAS